jgi:putative tributyrin esterase
VKKSNCHPERSEASAERSRGTPCLRAAAPASPSFFSRRPRVTVVIPQHPPAAPLPYFVLLSVCAALSLLAGCRKTSDQAPADHPRLTPKVALRDVIFRSVALNRDMQYRVLAPVDIAPGTKLPVVYLLHGGGGGFRDWSNYSDVARFAEQGLILVMPEGDESYYTNSREHPQDRYEDYIVNDLVSDVETRLPASPGRANRAIVGVSMGGFGAVKLALRHPELFCFAVGLSSAIDVPSRPFSINRIGQWRHHSSIFGAWGSETRRENDPFVLVRSVDPSKIPYLYLTCGEQEGLLPANRSFARLLQQREFAYEFHAVPGGHDWNQWNEQLDGCFRSLFAHLHLQP